MTDQVKFTITVSANRTTVHTQGGGIAPFHAIRLAIDALDAERQEINRCPYHRLKDRPRIRATQQGA